MNSTLKPRFYTVLKEQFDLFFPQDKTRTFAAMLRKIGALAGVSTLQESSSPCENFTESLRKLAEFFGENPEDLFEIGCPVEFIRFDEKVHAAVEVSDDYDVKETNKIVDDLLSTLPSKGESVIRLRFGLGKDTAQEHTLKEIAEMYECTGAWIRDIEARNLRRLRTAPYQQLRGLVSREPTKRMLAKERHLRQREELESRKEAARLIEDSRRKINAACDAARLAAEEAEKRRQLRQTTLLQSITISRNQI